MEVLWKVMKSIITIIVCLVEFKKGKLRDIQTDRNHTNKQKAFNIQTSAQVKSVSFDINPARS